MADNSHQIQKLRTFADDLARAQGKQPTPRKQADETAPVSLPIIEQPVPQPKVPAEPTDTSPEPAKPIPPIGRGPQSDNSAGVSFSIPSTKADTSKQPLNQHIPLSQLGKPGANAEAARVDSILTTEDDVFDVSAAHRGHDSGSIVTDRKRKRFRVIPATIEMMRAWFDKQIERFSGYTEGTQEVISESPIEEAGEQNKVLEKAAKRGALVPSDDHETLIEKRKEVPISKGLESSATSTASEKATPSWTHVKQVESEEQPSEPQAPPRPPTIEQHEPSLSQDVSYEIPGGKTEAVTPELAASEISEEIPEVPITEQTTEPESPFLKPLTWVQQPANEEAEPTVQEVTPETKEVSVPEEEPQATESGLIYTQFQPPPQSQPIPGRGAQYAPVQKPVSASYFMAQLIAVVVFAVVGGVGLAVWLFNDGETTPISTTPQVVSLIQAEEQIAVPLTQNRSGLMQSIINIQPRTTTVIAQAYPSIDVAGGSAPATTDEILNVLSLQAPLSFQRTVKEINFGLYRNSEPFIVITVESFDAALSGMLSWEGSISADLSPLFGEPVRGTFDPRARSATQIVAPHFIDTTVSNYDVRVLVNEIQDDSISYSFIDRNTILITTTRGVLEDIAPAVR